MSINKKLLSVLSALLPLACLALSGCGSSPSAEFDESSITLSIAVISDTHITGLSNDNAIKFTNALTQLGARAAIDDADGLDGVMVVGDLINSAVAESMQSFKELYESVYSPLEVPMIYTVGNHDMNPTYSWTGSTVAQSKTMSSVLGSDYFRTDADSVMRNGYEARHCVIGGYHILAVTPNGDQPVVYDPVVLSWLDERLAAITDAEPNRYVIVLTHPMIYGTVYGSLLGESDEYPWKSALPSYWATRSLTDILEKYPQVISFHGHLHFPINDPRSIWQGSWTALGCGSTSYMAIEPGGYEDMASATTMNDRDDFSQGYLMQIDVNGNARIEKMDFFNGSVIGEPYVIQYPAPDGANLAKYSNAARERANKAPVMGAVESPSVAEGEIPVIKFVSGTDDEFVHHYVITVTKCAEPTPVSGVMSGNSVPGEAMPGEKSLADGKTASEEAPVVTKRVLADFYRYPSFSQMKSEWEVSLGSLEPGEYEVKVTAIDSWDAESEPVTAKLTVGR